MCHSLARSLSNHEQMGMASQLISVILIGHTHISPAYSVAALNYSIVDIINKCISSHNLKLCSKDKIIVQ